MRVKIASHMRAALLLTTFDFHMAATPQNNRFHHMLLGLVGTSFFVLLGMHVLNPSNTVSKAPKAVLKPVEHKKLSKADMDAIAGESPSSLNGRLTVNDLNQTFNKIGYELDPVLKGTSDVPRVFLTSLPIDLAKIKQSEERKSLFFRTLLPLVLKINEELHEKRAKVWRFRHRLNIGLDIAGKDRIWLSGLFKRYRVEQGNFDALLQKMDVVPPSLALAQAAEESGWGTSRFAREGNALFGQWTFNPKDKGIVPQGRDQGKSHRIKAFDSLADSLRAYVHNLNTHKAYLGLRKKRAAMRTSHQELSGYDLARTLDKYSERGEHYVTSLHSIMSQNELGRFDQTALDGGEATILKGPLI
ncbi:glucosaminidase domain-containing protein [Terasakiella sp. SH-1]|uniref:glucosaminidase domain-containing protein n=1 Tax=Terasakiella sp. SH-1 TaxID=2560057 RepID=UPI0010733AFB|nr:glucosaminidase domain-containing protein [Terasakiella sp. SH-1]